MSYLRKDYYVTRALITPEFFLQIVKALDGTDTIDIKIKGKLEVEKDKLFINGESVVVTAEELNTLSERTPGVTEGEKPIIPDENKKIDELEIEHLTISTLVERSPNLQTPGKIVFHNTFI